jgi:GTP-binding protein
LRRDSINFYQGYAGLHIVDLPGYGFAFAKEEKKEQWAALLQDFIRTRAVLKRIYLLIDARHGMSRESYCTCTRMFLWEACMAGVHELG